MPRRVETMTFLHNLKTSDLKDLAEPLLIRKHPDEPIVVLVPYGEFMEMQRMIFDLEEQVKQWTNRKPSA